tara:strand:+ start:77 stop:367 length:291 start_codon:yes stop_codon:yes gene_type:complete
VRGRLLRLAARLLVPLRGGRLEGEMVALAGVGEGVRPVTGLVDAVEMKTLSPISMPKRSILQQRWWTLFFRFSKSMRTSTFESPSLRAMGLGVPEL